MKRILYCVVCDIDLTGTPVFVRDVTNNLNDEYEILVYTPRKVIRNIYSDRVTVIEGNCKGEGIAFLRNVKANLQQHFKNMCIDIVHINTANLLFTNVLADYFYGKVPLIISHSHNAINYGKDIIHKLVVPFARKNITKKTNAFLACSEDAGRCMFANNRKYRVMHNFIDTKKFRFSQMSRNTIREQYQHEYILGNIGAFNGQKNQMFLIKLAEKLGKRFGVLLIGDGEKRVACEQYCRENNVSNVYFINACENIHEYYSAFDAFLLPSLHEGNPRVLLEAEVSNLKKFASVHVPPSSAWTCEYLPLDEDVWLYHIQSYVRGALEDRCDNTDRIEQNGFGAGAIMRELKSVYESC